MIIPFFIKEAMIRTIRSFILTICIVAFITPGLAHGQTKRNSRLDISGTLMLRYDDNAFSLSDKNQDRFKANPQLFPGIESIDDFIWQPILRAAYRMKGHVYPSSLWLRVSGNFYQENSRRSYQSFTGGWRQNLPAKIRGLVIYTFIPRYFVGERLVSNTAIETETLQLHRVTLKLSRIFSPSFNGWLQGGFSILNFNDAFDALDTAILRGGLGATYRFNRNFKLDSQYSLDVASNEGGVINNDLRNISSITHNGFISPVFKLFKQGFLRLRYSLRHTHFTADSSQDPDNYGRRDSKHTLFIGLTYWLNKNMSANFFYDRAMKYSNRDFSNYNKNRYFFGMTYRFRALRRE